MLTRRSQIVLIFAVCFCVLLCKPLSAIEFGDRNADRDQAISRLPMSRLTPEARHRVEQIISRPTMFRRLPTQGMDCDRDMFLFLVRHPEVLVGIWDIMDITQVQLKRMGPYNLVASDGQGTTCEIELVYGDANTHLYVARGKYEGAMVAKPITGSGVFVLHSSYARSSSDRVTIGGQMDVFLNLDSLGADLVVRTLGPLIGKSADHNFVETAKFITQVSQASEVNPAGVKKLGLQLPQVTEPVRQQFIETALAVADRAGNSIDDFEPVAASDAPSPLDNAINGTPASASAATVEAPHFESPKRIAAVRPEKPSMNLRR